MQFNKYTHTHTHTHTVNVSPERELVSTLGNEIQTCFHIFPIIYGSSNSERVFVLIIQPILLPPKPLDYSGGLVAFRLFFKKHKQKQQQKKKDNHIINNTRRARKAFSAAGDVRKAAVLQAAEYNPGRREDKGKDNECDTQWNKKKRTQKEGKGDSNQMK